MKFHLESMIGHICYYIKYTAITRNIISVCDCLAGPSEHYWETLAERRRVALEKALKENEQQHERISLLEQENEQYKVLLDEAKTVIETFQVRKHIF